MQEISASLAGITGPAGFIVLVIFLPDRVDQFFAPSIPYYAVKALRQNGWFFNREHGSIFDDWLKSGALPLTHAEAEEMDRMCSPEVVQEEVSPDHGQLLYSATLEPLEVRCAVFTPI
ncbi:MAG: hypothetical protein HDT27_02255 [Subdoligranulum sp.]|nr:hypothetical protein [Subdoligranulum sp.]